MRDSEHAAGGHGSHRKLYLQNFGWLVMLTVVELHFVKMFTGAGLAIMLVGAAVTKAALVAMYFMHLRFDKRTLAMVSCMPLLFATILVIGLMPDSAHWGLRG